MLAQDLVEVMVCPKSKDRLIYFPRGEADRTEGEAFLFCPTSRLRYRIEAGVPVMLIAEAVEVDPGGTAALVARAKELGLS